MSLVLMLIVSLGGLLALSPKFSPHLGRTWDTLFALFYPADAVLFGYYAIKQWKRYVAIKSGAVIYAPDGKGNPIVLALLLTVLAAAGTYLSVSLMRTIPFGPWLFIGTIISEAIVGLLWAWTLLNW